MLIHRSIFSSHALQHASPEYHLSVAVHGFEFLHVTFDIYVKIKNRNVSLLNYSFISSASLIRRHLQCTRMTGVVKMLSRLLCLKLPSCQCLPPGLSVCLIRVITLKPLWRLWC